MVLKTLKENGANATKLILAAVPAIAQQDWTKTIQDLKVVKVAYYRLLDFFGSISNSNFKRCGVHGEWDTKPMQAVTLCVHGEWDTNQCKQ